MKYVSPAEISPQQMNIFLAAARAENFSAAAEKLGVSQPLVSRTMANLEELLGFPLFERVPRGMLLTDAGRVLFREWSDIYAQIAKSVEMAHRAHVQRGATLTIVDDPATDKKQYLYPILQMFRDRYPDIEVIVEQMDLPDAINAMESMKVDGGFALTGRNENDLQGRKLCWKRLQESGMYACVPQGLPIYDRAELEFRDFEGIPIALVQPDARTTYTTDLLNMFKESGVEPMIHSYSKDGYSLFMKCGITNAVIMSNCFIKRTEHPNVRYIPVKAPAVWLSAIWNPESGNPNTERFIAVVEEFFAANGEPR